MKVKTTSSTELKPNAWICNPKDKGRKPIKSATTYLNDGDEFLIELFNPLNLSVLADIKVNGSSVSKNGLVLRPGERFYLDCFIDDKKKFIFKTYEVEDTDQTKTAIANNGKVEVFFYKEEVQSINNWQRYNQVVIREYYPYYVPTYYPTWPSPNTIWFGSTPTITYGSNTGGITTGSTNVTFNSTSGTVNLNNTTTSGTTYGGVLNNATYTNSTPQLNIQSLETGRIEKGSKSEQKFSEVDMEFQKFYVSSTIITLLPESRKPAETSELKKPNWNELIKRNDEETISLIKKLGELHKAGILTDDEFSSKKAELLSKI